MGTGSNSDGGLDRSEAGEKEREQTPFTATSNELPTPLPRTSPFLFISTNEEVASGMHNDESRTLARIHVMSTFYRKKNFPQDEENKN